MNRERPQAIGELVGGLLEKLGVAAGVERAEVVGHWEEFVGPHIARVARPLRVSGATLFVEVRGASWLMELNMMKRELLKRLNAGRRTGRIERLVFVQQDGDG